MSAARERSRNLIVDGPQTIKYLIYVGVCRTFPLLFLLRCESILFFQQQKKASGSACFFQLIPSLNLKASLTSSHPHLAPFFFSIKKAAAIVDKLIDANGGITRPSPCCCHCSSNVICFAVKKTILIETNKQNSNYFSQNVNVCVCVQGGKNQTHFTREEQTVET